MAEEIRIEKLNEQWAGIPHKQLLNQSFQDQLNSLQILEQLAPLELAKQHLPADIIDIQECLGKADNIPFNQLYYIVENCMDRYYTKVIKTFVSIIKRQFADRQLLLVNTVHYLKFLEEYSDRQAQIWKIFHKHHNIPDDLENLHLHFDNFKTSLETDFNHLKEATSHNIQNIQMSLNLQQMYSSSLCLHINNIYSKLSELQKQIQHHHMYMNQGDTVQIEAPEFDPDIDGDRPPSTVEKPDEVSIQGTLPTNPEVTEPEDDNRSTPGTNTEEPTCQKTILMQIPRVSSLTAQPEEQGHNRCQAQHYTENYEIPELEENPEEEQLLILICLWHIIIHIEPVNKSDKNTLPIYKIWTTTNITPRLTGQTFLRVHWLHRTISWQISKKPCEDLWKSSREYLAEAEVKPGKKSYTVIAHLALELIPCKVLFSTRARRISIYVKVHYSLLMF